MEFSSLVNRGTTVCIRLPLANAELSGVAPGADEDDSNSGDRRVMVVDDDENIRDVFRLMLRQLGFDVITAGSGEEAVSLMLDRGLMLDFVVLDLKMPGMTGWQCHEEVRRLRPGLPVIISSGYDPSPESRKADFPDVFLRKPFSLQSLRQAVTSILETRHSELEQQTQRTKVLTGSL